MFYLVQHKDDNSPKGLNIRKEGSLDQAVEIQYFYEVENGQRKSDLSSFEEFRKYLLSLSI